MAIRKELIDELMATSEGPLIGPDGLSKELTKALVERMLAGELNHHLGYEKNFTIYDTDDSKSLIKAILKEQGLDDKIYKPNQVDKNLIVVAYNGHVKELGSFFTANTKRKVVGYVNNAYNLDINPKEISWQDLLMEVDKLD